MTAASDPVGEPLTATPPSAGTGLRVYLGGLACGAVATLATPTAVLGAALLLPSFLALVTDRGEGRPVTRCILLWGLAGALPTLAALWTGPDRLDAALGEAVDIGRLAPAWAAQAAAWLLAEGLPVLGRLLAEAHTARRARQLRAQRARIAEEWSLQLDNGNDAAA